MTTELYIPPSRKSSGNVLRISNHPAIHKEQLKKELQERKRSVFHLILKYLLDHNLNITAETLQTEAQLGSQHRVCDNIDLDIILQEYQSYYYTKFQKEPHILRVNEDSAATKEKRKSSGNAKTKPVLVQNKNERQSQQEDEDPFKFTIKSMAAGDKKCDTNVEVEEMKLLPVLCNFENYSPEWREMADEVMRQVVPKNLGVTWADCIGLSTAVELIKEAVVYPLQYPELFRSLQTWRGILLYGPPGFVCYRPIGFDLAIEGGRARSNPIASDIRSSVKPPKDMIDQSTLLQLFCRLNLRQVLFKITTGKASSDNPGGLTQPSVSDDFDPNILSDDLMEKSSPSLSPLKNHHCHHAITLCAKTVLAHLVTHLGHFPMAIGAARLSSLVVEHDDVSNLSSDELSIDIFSAPNIQLFMLSENVIASLIELPMLDLPGGGVTAGLSTADKQVRVLLRDLSGKASWDASILYRAPETFSDDDTNNSNVPTVDSDWGPVSYLQPESFMIESAHNNLPQRAMRHRPPGVLPVISNAAPDLDQLDDLLQYLGHTSPECLESFDRKLNEPTTAPFSMEVEQEAIAAVINQRNLEVEENRVVQHTNAMLGQKISRPSSRNESGLSSGPESNTPQSSTGAVEQNAFQQCRLLFSQLGLAGWERRKQLHLLNKTERLLRELRNLDSQRCRETHKVAVIYVAPGQEDKNSILSNQGGSAAYEQFLAALAWEVELEGHTGFLGGLTKQGSTGLTAPYVATSFSEAIFHVATRMPGDTPETILNKTRHLGNDEVHIVWSEHSRDYRRDIIPTEFCDILITIYPLGNNLNRVTVHCKPDVPHFGILFNEAIVESNIVAGLVRATAFCASRAKRTTLPFYQQYYEERALSLETVVTKHKNSTTFEDFISRVYSPIATPSPFCASGMTSSGAGDGPSCTSNPSMLAALLDSHGHSHKPNQRSDSKYRVSASDAARGVWFNNNIDALQNVESTSISPRPLKKISSSLKGVPKRTLRQETPSESPPDSPQQFLRKK